MKAFKKLMIFALCAIMLLSCSCNAGGGETTTEPTPENTPAVTDPATEPETEPEEDGPLALTLSYDDYLTDIEGVLPTDAGVSITSGTAVEIIESKGTTYFHAKEIGNATIDLAGRPVEITVKKAKLNLIVIMGQSNSGNHFANATSDITNPLGTAYWWGGGRGLGARTPYDFTQATQGFHSTLLAELYAQSVAAGDPVKNVLVWHEGGNQQGAGTSKNGSSIYGWAASPTDTKGTDFTVQLVAKCDEYYATMADQYEIVSRGVYWLQGEGDGVRGIDPNEYIACFEAIWNKLKTEAKLEYMAIMRVRKGGDSNTLNNDIDYSTTVSAQFALANKHPDIFMATTITENFTGAPTDKKAIDITNYIRMMAQYSAESSHDDFYGNTANYKNGTLTTPMKTLFGSNNNNHYGKFGYTIISSDAAYNMTRALKGSEYSFVMADASGDPKVQKASKAGDVVELDITEMMYDLAFRAAPGSTAGTTSIKVTSNGTDVTADVINTSGASFGCANIKKLKDYDKVVITVTYTTVAGASGSVTYNITDNSFDLPDYLPAQYTWDFNGDLLARDKDGNVVNAINAKELLGAYVISDGILICDKAQLEIVKPIEFAIDKNWSIEIGFGDITGASGFIIASEQTNILGNKAISYRGGKFTISDYAIKAHAANGGYYNYSDEGSRLSSGCSIKLVNTYEAATGTSTMSIWRNGELTVVNIQNVNGDFNGGSAIDMSPYDVTADFIFRYLGNSNSSGSFLLTNQIDYIKVDTGN
ncbi:MAG: hypothetical protein J6S71_01950 [Clostridia bacterium]|nr:hypothetical protein [Clostridia bacterium]